MEVLYNLMCIFFACLVPHYLNDTFGAN
uniref:Uncharacterized protein n=1 Tax=Arundo donax TaxID=35708 RepID=A0A0A9HY49_ARUDO